jgi:hypothetical protein
MRSTKRTQMAPEYTIGDTVRTDDPADLQGAFKAAMRRFAATVTIITVANGDVRWAGVCSSDMHNYLADGFTCGKASDGLWGTLQWNLLGNAGLDTPFL